MKHITCFFLCMLLLRSAISQQVNPSFEIIRHLNEINGSFTNNVYRVAFGNNGKCYFASNKGIGSYDGRSVQRLTMQDGLPDNEIFNLKIKDSTLFFLPLKGGLYSYNYLTEKPIFKKRASVNDVLKEIIISDTTLLLCTYSYIFSSWQTNSIIPKITFKWNHTKVVVFENDFYMLTENDFLKFNSKTNVCDTLIKNKKGIKTLCVSKKKLFYSYHNYFYSKNLQSNKTDSTFFPLFSKIELPKTISLINDSLFFVVSGKTLLTFNSKTGHTENILENVDINNITYNPIDHYHYISTNNGLYILRNNLYRSYILNTFNYNLSYLHLDTARHYSAGFENGDALFENHIYKNPYKVNQLINYKHQLICGLDVGFKVFDTRTKSEVMDFTLSSIKKMALTDSSVYMTTSSVLYKFDLNNFILKRIIQKNHRSYYLQQHGNKLYTQSYNTDTLFSVNITNDKIVPLGSVKGQVIKSIETKNTIYFLTDLAYLYIYDKKTLTGINISDHIYYPITALSYFELYTDHFLIGNNDVCISISKSDVERNIWRFRPIPLYLPKEAHFVQINHNTLYYALNNTIRYFPVSFINTEKNFYSLNLKKTQTTSYRDNLFARPLGRFNTSFETINYTGNDEVITCYIISPGQKLVKRSLHEMTLLIDSLPIGISYMVCFATDNKLNRSNIISIPINVTDTSTQKIVITLAMYGLCILLLAFLVFRYILLNLKKQHRLKMELIMLEQKVGALLMNPHFVFNALSNIQGFIGSKQLEKANTYLLKFSLVIRSYINFMRKGIITLNDELESVWHFIEFQQIKYEGKLEFNVVKAPDLNTEGINIPAFILQPFIENSIKHFKNHKPILSVEVTISSVINNSYTITITDNGPGLNKEIIEKGFSEPDHETREFKSLAFTLQRLKKIHEANKLHFHFTIENRNNEQGVREGLKVVLHLNTLPNY